MKEDLKTAIDGCITDACNRYLNALDEHGLVKKARRTDERAILEVRNQVLSEWLPSYVARVAQAAADDD